MPEGYHQFRPTAVVHCHDPELRQVGRPERRAPSQQPRCGDDVRVQALVETKVPAIIAPGRLSTSGKNERCTVFRIDLQEVSLGVDADGRPKCEQLIEDCRNPVGMAPPHAPINLDVGEVLSGSQPISV